MVDDVMVLCVAPVEEELVSTLVVVLEVVLRVMFCSTDAKLAMLGSVIGTR